MFLEEEDILSIKEGSLLIDIKTEKLYLVKKVCERCIYFRFYSSGIWKTKSESKKWKIYIITYSVGNSYRVVPIPIFRRGLEKKTKRLIELEAIY